MPIIKVRIVAETIIDIDTENLDTYEELDTYLQGVSIDDATSKQLAVAMVRFDDEEDSLELNDQDWKVIGINTLD
jgi:hypothetical protein